MATDLPYPLPNPRPCGGAGIPASAYGEPEKEEGGGRGMGGFARGALAFAGVFVAFGIMTLLVPVEKEKPTVFLPVKPRKPYLPQ